MTRTSADGSVAFSLRFAPPTGSCYGTACTWPAGPPGGRAHIAAACESLADVYVISFIADAYVICPGKLTLMSYLSSHPPHRRTARPGQPHPASPAPGFPVPWLRNRAHRHPAPPAPLFPPPAPLCPAPATTSVPPQCPRAGRHLSAPAPAAISVPPRRPPSRCPRTSPPPRGAPGGARTERPPGTPALRRSPALGVVTAPWLYVRVYSGPYRGTTTASRSRSRSRPSADRHRLLDRGCRIYQCIYCFSY